MNTSVRLNTLAGALLLALSFSAANAASLTYHGNLQDGGKPANGNYDIRLTLYPSQTGGTAIGSPVTLYSVPVKNGAFSTEVDFGAAANNGNPVWVGAAVAPAGSSQFVALNGRSAASLDETSGTCSGDWSISGNSGNPSGSFLGNIDSQPLVFEVSNSTVGVLAPSTDANVPDAPNVVFGVGGAAGAGSTIAGGGRPEAYCGISGTMDCMNSIIGNYNAIGGGRGNAIAGYASTIPGGADNVVINNFDFAAGRNAVADTDGSFVWSDDSVQAQFGSGTNTPNDFLVRATGLVLFATATDGNGNTTSGVELTHGSGSWANVSDRNAKTAITTVSPGDVLAGVLKMPISTWQYKAESPDIRHLGPMAQDFFAAFHLGKDNRHITDIDEGGVALAAIQGLNQKLEHEFKKVTDENAALKAQNAALTAKLAQLDARMTSLEVAQHAMPTAPYQVAERGE